MEIGKAMRLGRLFQRTTGRSVIVALDHGLGGVPEGLERPEPVLDAILAAQPDGLLISPGTFVRFHRRLAGAGVGVVVTVDMRLTRTYPGGEPLGEAHECVARLERLAAMGVDGIKALLVFGRESLAVHAKNAAFVAELIQASWTWGLPVMVEAVLWGAKTRERQREPELIRHIVRTSWEMGADLIKVTPPADEGALAEMASACPVPLLVLGGARTDRPAEALRTAAAAVAAGARGVVFGRNVWQHPDPAGMVHALRAVVHAGRPWEEVAAGLS